MPDSEYSGEPGPDQDVINDFVAPHGRVPVYYDETDGLVRLDGTAVPVESSGPQENLNGLQMIEPDGQTVDDSGASTIDLSHTGPYQIVVTGAAIWIDPAEVPAPTGEPTFPSGYVDALEGSEEDLAEPFHAITAPGETAVIYRLVGEFKVPEGLRTGADIAGGGNIVADAALQAGTYLQLSDGRVSVEDDTLMFTPSGGSARPVERGVGIDSAQIVTSVTQAANTSVQAVAGLTRTVEIADRPVIVEATGWAITAASTTNATIWLYEDGVQIAAATIEAGTAFRAFPCLRARRAPTAGDHTYDVRTSASGSVAITVGALSNAPTLLTIIEI